MEEIWLKLEQISKEIENFEVKKTWDCKKLQVLCEEKQRLVGLLNLYQSGYQPTPRRKPIFGVRI